MTRRPSLPRAVAATALTGALLVTALPSTGAAAPGWTDTGARDAVMDAWWDELSKDPWIYTPVGFASRCQNVALSPEYERAVTDRVSFDRAMAGVDASLAVDPARSARAQAAALIISAQGQVGGDPPQGWRCWSPEGAAGPSESLTTLGAHGAAGVDRLVENAEPDDASVSRRAGLLAPALRTVGIGAMPYQGGPADSLAVSVAVPPSPDGPSREGQGIVLRPPRGHLPRLEAPARWSVPQQQEGRDLTGATAAVTADGRAVQAPVVASGRDRVVFEPRITANATDGADPREDIAVDVDVTVPSDGSHVRYRSTLAWFAPRGSERDRELLITAWYDEFLDRPFDPDARYWTGRVRTVGRLAALREMYHPPEAVTRPVGLTYDDLLGRQPNRGEVAYRSPGEVESTISDKVLIGTTHEYRRSLGDAVPSRP